MLHPSATVAALALLATSATASSWGMHSHQEIVRNHLTSILSPHVPPISPGRSVWEPMLSFDEKTKPQATRKSTSSVELKFIRQQDMQGNFVATVFIGTPPQPVTLQLATVGTEVFFINHKLENHRFYDHSKSSTYKANGTWFHYGDVLSGYTSRDVITIGDPEAKHTIQALDSLFLELNGRDDVLARMESDGVVSLGPFASVATGAPSIVRTMINQKTLDQPMVGIYVDEHEADVLFGGIDSMHLGSPISYFPVPKDTYAWSIPVAGVSVGGKQILKDKLVGIPHTGNFVLGPQKAVDAIAEAVGVESDVVACDTPGPNITFAIGQDLQVTLKKEDYTMPTEQDNVCLFIFFGTKKFDKWSLGNQFLQKVYLILDYGESEDQTRTGIALSTPSPF